MLQVPYVPACVDKPVADFTNDACDDYPKTNENVDHEDEYIALLKMTLDTACSDVTVSQEAPRTDWGFDFDLDEVVCTLTCLHARTHIHAHTVTRTHTHATVQIDDHVLAALQDIEGATPWAVFATPDCGGASKT